MNSNLPNKINCLSKHRGFKMAFLNIFGLPKRFDEIKCTMSEKLLVIKFHSVKPDLTKK